MTDTSRPSNGGDRGQNLDALRQFFILWLEQIERFQEERDRRYSEKFIASETAVNAALIAAKEAVAAALISNEKAITKAEIAQKEYNERSNEFRGQLDDQAKTLMPRMEAMLLISTLTDKLDSERANGLGRWEEIKKEVAALRESRSQIEGRQANVVEQRQSSQWSVGLLVGSIIGGVGVLSGIVSLVIALTGR